MAGVATVVDNPEQHRYEARVDGELAGFAEYRRRGDRIVFTHTEVDDAFEGHGIGGRLASFALDDARARGLVVVAQCPFIGTYIRRHPEYEDLLNAS
jgi:predicted GNAT family acetyltransferase